jgi:hypothetical protein
MNSSINNSYINNNSPNAFPTSRYGPFGYNDNNSARQRTPSNLFPQNGGMQGSPLNRFNPMTTNAIKNINSMPSMSNFNKAFQQNGPLIDPINYENQNNMIHNNVGDTVLDEHIVEYRINIDSLDRDIRVYPDPFNFTVKFNPPGSSIIKSEELIDPRNPSKGTRIIQERVEGSPQPHINREFRNVKYIKLDSITLPQFTQIKRDEETHQYKFDNDSLLLDDRFVVLRIKELDDDTGIRTFDTGDSGERVDEDDVVRSHIKPFSLLFPDKVLGRNYYCATPYHGNKIYNNSMLGNLNKMTLEFYDSCDKPLKYNDLFTARQIELANKKGDPIPRSDLRHPLNKKTQVHMSFIIGVVESQMNTNTKFSH